MTNAVTINTEFRIYVTHVDTDGAFLRIYGQTDQENSLRLEKIMQPLSAQFAKGLGRPSPYTNLAPNLICCAMFETSYYRARICSERYPGAYVVQFIDYGNTEILDIENIRLIDGLPEAAQLLEVQPQCTDYILSGVQPKNGNWDGETIGTILSNLRYNEYPARVVNVIGKYRLISMLWGMEELSAFLVNQNLAMPASIEEMFTRESRYIQQPQIHLQKPAMQRHDQHPPMHTPKVQMHVHGFQHGIRDTLTQKQNSYPHRKQIPMHPVPPMQQYHSNPSQENWRAHAQPQPLISPSLRQTKSPPLAESQMQDASVFTFKSRPIEIDTQHEVVVSYVEDGPQLFSVQLTSTVEELATLMHSINSHTPQPLVEPPLIGSVCLGRYSVDKRLLRAVVMKVTEHRCKLHYVDYGYGEVLPYPEIYQIPPQYTIPAVMAMRFTLNRVNELNVTEEMKQFFKNLVNGRKLHLHVRPSESSSPLIRYGDLYDSGRNVRDMLRAAFPDEIAPWQAALKLATGAQEIVIVVHVESCNKFYVQLDRDGPLFETLVPYIAENAKTAPAFKPSQVRPRLPVIGFSSTHCKWSRAEIINIVGDKATVFFVDYGNEETISLTAIRTIRDTAITKLRAQAIRCILSNTEDCSITDFDNKLQAAILNRRMAMRVKNVVPAGAIVDLFDPSSTPMENVLQKLKQNFTNGNVTPRNCNDKNQNSLNMSARRSNVKTQPTVGQQQQKSKSKNVKASREDQGNKWSNVSRGDPPKIQESQPAMNSKLKNWKEDENEQRRFDNRYHNRGNEPRSMGPVNPQNERFSNREDGKNERFSRDGPRPERNDRNERYDRPDDPNANIRGGARGARGADRGFGNSRFSGNNSRSERNGSADKSWSDKDSDSSSRGSGRHGRRGSGSRAGGSRGRREGAASVRTPNSRDSEGDDRSFKPRSNGSSRIKDVRRDFADKNENKQFDSWANKPTQSSTTVSIPPPNITVGAVKNCDLVFINSPSDFQVQLSPDNLELEAVMANIEATYANGGKILQKSAIKPGINCVAQYSEDNMWYRATIQRVSADGATVYFVDYGNSETVKFDKIKELEPSLAKLAAQAIACKLLAAEKSIWKPSEIAKFSELVEGKSLEGEFVAFDNNVYEILLREVVEGTPSMKYINEEFSGGADLALAKNIARNKGRQGRVPIVEPTDYAPLDQTWTVQAISCGSKHDVIVTWFTNPDNFYCQTLTHKDEFRTMMNEIQRVYAKRTPQSEPLKVGSAVIAIFSEDGAMYRAEVLELNETHGHIIRYVDFGNCAMVEPRNIYRVEKRFMKMPKQAVHCSLKNVIPANGSSWSKANRQEIDKCFDGDSYECSFHEIKDDKYIISLNNGRVDVAGQMVEKSLAAFAVSGTIVEDNAAAVEISNKPKNEDLQRFDISLLAGQKLRVKVSNVASVAKFYIQLPTATINDKIINAYMAENNPEVMPRLSFREVCLGAGCLVDTDEGWRRAVVVNCSRTTGFDVRFIDTGANDEIPLDCMLALPGKLSAMQNQAVECCSKNATSSLKVDEEFRERVENTDVIMAVDEVDNNRLIVELYDTTGKRIKVSPDEPDSTICPVCPMPILSSTHAVAVSHADHSSSVWLKRESDMLTDAELLSQLYDYYSQFGENPTLTPGTLCAALSSDGNWYRAIILDSSKVQVHVRFLDYGNTEEVSPDSVKALEPQFQTQSQLVIEVALTVTLGGSKDQQRQILASHIVDEKFTATLYNVRKKWVAELTDEEGGKISEKLSALSVIEVSKNREVQGEVPEMVVGGRYTVSCTHADSPAQFWLQRVEELPAIEQQQERLQADSPNYPDLRGIPELDTLCVAVFSADEQWYRAEVLDADEEIVTIRCIDYGFTDVVDSNVGKIKQIPDSLKTTKRYATKCRLDVIPFGADDWIISACEYFDSLLNSTEKIEALVIADSNPRRVELFLDGESAVEKLVKKNYATKIHTEEDLIDEIIEREVDPRAAYVSHAISPSEFWMQQELFVGDLEVLADRFIIADMFPKIEDVKEGLLCVAKFPEDESWYRARVVSHAGDGGTEVIYIDYGNSAISTEIREIPEDLAVLPPFSKKCCLALPPGVEQWSEEAEIEFVKMAADGATVFLLDVLEEGEDTSVVRLTQDGEDIVDKLSELCERRVPVIEERLPPLGEENSPNVVVSHIESPSEFWTQAESVMTELEIMGDHLAAAESFLPLEDIQEGAVCAAQFPEDGQWYRARVVDNGQQGTEVLFIDYGNTAVTPNLKRLPEDIVNIQALSTCCSLDMPKDAESWSEKACEKFIDLVAEGKTMFQCEVLEEKERTVVKLILDGKDIVESLAELCEKKKEASDAPVQEVEEKTANVESGEQTEKEGVKEVVEIATESAVTSETSEICVEERIVSGEEKNGDEKSSLDTSGIEITTTSDTMSFSSSSKIDSSEESNNVVLSESECTSRTVGSKNEIVVKENGFEVSMPESLPSSVELAEGGPNRNALEISMPEASGSVFESSTPEPSVAESREQVRTPKIPIMDKIVPGCISRGLSQEEIIVQQVERRNSVPVEEKIVPGSINKGEDLEGEVSAEEEKKEEKKDAKQEIPKDTCETPTSTETLRPAPLTKHETEEKIVPGSVSRGESPLEEPKRPSTPKTPHSEKLVAGVVNLQEKLTELEADETLTIVVEDNIPTVN